MNPRAKIGAAELRDGNAAAFRPECKFDDAIDVSQGFTIITSDEQGRPMLRGEPEERLNQALVLKRIVREPPEMVEAVDEDAFGILLLDRFRNFLRQGLAFDLGGREDIVASRAGVPAARKWSPNVVLPAPGCPCTR